MRYVKKNFTPPPPQLKEFAEKHEMEFLAGDKKLKGKFSQKVRPHLDKLYYGKCAYCESYSKPTSTIEIDHYRPTSKYNWLTFEWSNLLPACPTCNRKKGDKFPVQYEERTLNNPGCSDRLVNSEALMGEGPLILNPELDNPMDYLVYFPPDGEIAAKSGNLRGKKTIEVCELDRDDLKEAYKRQIDVVVNSIEDKTLITINFISRNRSLFEEDEKYWLSVFYLRTFQELKKLQNPKNKIAYTQLGYYMYDGFDEFIINRLPDHKNARTIVRKAFRLFKEGKLEKEARNDG
jgi:uncharacterized protein (TIGR02646 family)